MSVVSLVMWLAVPLHVTRICFGICRRRILSSEGYVLLFVYVLLYLKVVNSFLLLVKNKSISACY